MKITIQLDLDNDNTNDKFTYDMINNGSTLLFSLTEIREYIRNKLKHCDLKDETEKHLEEIRSLIDFGKLDV